MPRLGRKTAHTARKPAPGRRRGAIEREILRIASLQYMMIRLDQLLAIGLSERGVQQRVADGRLFRLYPGVYAVGRPDVPLKGSWLAAVFACGEGAALSHESAAALLGLVKPGGAIHVSITSRSRRSHPGIDIHRPRHLLPADITAVDGISCTTVARTLFDVAGSRPRWLFLRLLEQAEVQDGLDMAAIEELLVRSPNHPGARRLRASLGSGGPGEGRVKSELERRFRRICKKAGLPKPAINEWLQVPGEEWQGDFVWHHQKLLVEVDGWTFHRTRLAFERDRRRDRLLALQGWRVARFTWRDLRDREDEVVSTLTRLLS
jgi:uncharacterized protein DUF559